MSEKKEPTTLELVTRINRTLCKIATPKAAVVLGMLNSLHDERSTEEQKDFSDKIRAEFMKQVVKAESENV